MGQRSHTRKRPRRGEGEKNGSHILLLRASRDTGTDLPVGYRFATDPRPRMRTTAEFFQPFHVEERLETSPETLARVLCIRYTKRVSRRDDGGEEEEEEEGEGEEDGEEEEEEEEGKKKRRV
ncbi:hypothetical protein HZH68_006369 [Vespula germanica]|uniref:Uncharacterized protein n=1 Tax=Vespula germanica TaxID=30212 RepID=A0A834NB74_VESGE|nr:hypothetical protein HZH68_006369 [Vespula germanica]